MSKKSIVSQEVVIHKILFIRGKKVILDSDIASLYGVETKVLNQAVKRNKGRFPGDFMFRLDRQEVANLKSQIVTSRWKTHGGQRKPPIVFTEQGVAMLSSVLNSEKAIRMNILIVRTFVRLRELVQTNSLLAGRIKELEAKTESHDKNFKMIYELINKLIVQEESPKQEIGYKL